MASVWRHHTQRGQTRLCIRCLRKPSDAVLDLLRGQASYRKGPIKGDEPCWYAQDEQSFTAAVVAQQHSSDADMHSLAQALSALQDPVAQPPALPAPPQIAQVPAEVAQNPPSPVANGGINASPEQHHVPPAMPSTTGQVNQRYTDLRQLIDERKALRQRCLACEQEDAFSDPCWQSSIPHNTTSIACWYTVDMPQ